MRHPPEAEMRLVLLWEGSRVQVGERPKFGGAFVLDGAQPGAGDRRAGAVIFVIPVHRHPVDARRPDLLAGANILYVVERVPRCCPVLQSPPHCVRSPSYRIADSACSVF